MRKQRIARYAGIVQVLVCIYAGYWFYEYTNRVLRHVFFKDWSTYRVVDDDLVVTAGMRAFAMPLYLPVFAVALANFYFAIRLLGCYRRAIIFDHRPASYLIGLGIALICILPIEILVGGLEPVFLTQWNAGGMVPFRYYYDAADISLAFCGIAFCLIGWITREGLYLQQENEGFV